MEKHEEMNWLMKAYGRNISQDWDEIGDVPRAGRVQISKENANFKNCEMLINERKCKMPSCKMGNEMGMVPATVDPDAPLNLLINSIHHSICDDQWIDHQCPTF